ncbi:MAG: rRNA maturation RNase YbeY [Candidatus Sungbacteria bacterium RIFCSPHIGHO2_02_FULL_47_11]|uniref:Endoribonuclease YbeY n=1 Tax=Candidatus Sungbacteria bacterium RIFCSPHIGHO2_02_FULL_47_11 TaxID=1802270 RepID=A0A1G2KG56_9BACT|nr:MAG: rRNA maturation RNase YbeY [Candidatus Sungbacteria bacterium RIFCSPHIGHO2_02_FULL_47_11]
MVANVQTLVKLLPVALRKKLPREVVVVHIGEKDSRRLNRRYRKKNRSTNVLSLRYGPDYGEILVCPTVIRQEAKRSSVPYKYQMTKMVVHAMVHLAGIHHEKSRNMSRRFERLEQRILKKFKTAI